MLHTLVNKLNVTNNPSRAKRILKEQNPLARRGPVWIVTWRGTMIFLKILKFVQIYLKTKNLFKIPLKFKLKNVNQTKPTTAMTCTSLLSLATCTRMRCLPENLYLPQTSELKFLVHQQPNVAAVLIMIQAKEHARG